MRKTHKIRLIACMRKVSSGHLLSIDTFYRVHILFADNEGPDQTARTFVVRIRSKTRFRMARPNYDTRSQIEDCMKSCNVIGISLRCDIFKVLNLNTLIRRVLYDPCTRVLQKVLSLGSDYFSATFNQTYFYYKPSKYSPFTETHFCNLFTQSRKADK